MIHSRYDASNGIMVHEAIDRVTMPDLVLAVRHWFADPRFDPEAPIIWILTDVDLDFSIDELSSLYPLIRTAADQTRKGAKTAWVVSSSLVASIIRVVHAEFDWGSDWMTFASLDHAVLWCLSS